MKRIILGLVMSLLTLPTSAREAEKQQDPQKITIGEKFSLASEVLGEERAYWVYLPASYHDSTYAPQRYPVLYLLDGDAHFHSASGVVQFMSTGINGNRQIPELILVAVPNTHRTRDLTPTQTNVGFDGKEDPFLEASGGGDKFLQFLREELFSEIESTYRTLPYRILVGHSFGGLLTLHALLDAPEMFQSYIAMDPSLWWDDQVLVQRAESRVKSARKPSGSAYISLVKAPDLGSLGDGTLLEKATRAFTKSLESAASPSFRSTLGYFEAEDHSSVPLLSLYHGLLYIFEGYKPSYTEFLEKPSTLSAHFERVSERLGLVLRPPEAFVDQLGYLLLYQIQDTDKAIELFKLNVSNYPASFNAYSSLGEAYKVQGENPSAVASYEKSLELNPANEKAKKQLETLRTQDEQK